MAFDLTISDKGRGEILDADGKWHHMWFRDPSDGSLKRMYRIPHGDKAIGLDLVGNATWTAANETADVAHHEQPESPFFLRFIRYRLASLPGGSPGSDWVRGTGEDAAYYLNATGVAGPWWLRARGKERVFWGIVYGALLLTTQENESYGFDFKVETSATPGDAGPPLALVDRVWKAGATS